MIAQLIFLVLVSAGSGYALLRLLGIDEEDRTARFFIAMAAGLVFFVQASVVLGFVGLAWWPVYLAITGGLLILAYRGSDVSFSLPEVSNGWKIVIALFIVHLLVYSIGASSYPWLEDDDPWEHAEGIRYVSLFGSYMQPDNQAIKYLAPYPPSYDVLLGVLYQADGTSLQGTLKFFNALLISLSIPFFYCWAKRRFDAKTALWAAFVLTVLPSFMSHFIWAQTISVMLVFPALYFLDRHLAADGRERKGLAVMAVLSMAAVMITAPSSAATFFGLVAAFIAALAIADYWENRRAADALRKVMPTAGLFIAAFALALAEFWVPMFLLFPADVVFSHLSLSESIFTEKLADTSGGLVYGFQDFWDAPFSSKMDQPVGWGPMAFLLVLAGLWAAAEGFKEKKRTATMAVVLLWFLYCMVGTEGNALPVKLVPHRFWVFLAIPVALLAGLGAARVQEYFGGRSKGFNILVLVILAGGLLVTSASAKYVVETSMWPPGVSFLSQEQLAGYVNLKTVLPANTKVFSMCGRFSPANGFDMFDYSWDGEVMDYRETAMNDSLEGNHGFLKRYGYEYIIVDHSCAAAYPPEEINQKLNQMDADGRFVVQQQLTGNAFIVFKVI